MKLLLVVVALPALAAVSTPVNAVVIDGHIEEAEWSGAQRITDFRMVQPLTRAPATHATEALVLPTEEGLAVAYRSRQPSGVPRSRQRTQRDELRSVDKVNLYIDFDGEGRTGFRFGLTLAGDVTDTTITNENQFNDDWDGLWKHATQEDESGWYAEMLIPWHIAPMRDGRDGKRTIGLLLERVVAATGERTSWPAVSAEESRFLSSFSKVEVPAYSQPVFAVTPYVVGVHDRVGGGSDFDAGVDIFWKPHNRLQVSGTLNPDFGQVESDQLVVNFSATETFLDEKRPFFTENQGFFDVPFGSFSSQSQLMYTRRIGAPSDDGSDAADVSAAAKVNGSAGALNYGLFVAGEKGENGRDFYAARVVSDFGAQGVGATMTHVERPFLDRQATVFEADHRWSPSPQWNIRSAVAESRIEQAGSTTRDVGGQLKIDWDMGEGWRQQLFLLHLGEDFNTNDFGYLARNDQNWIRYALTKRFTDMAESRPYSSADWQLVGARRTNGEGLHFGDLLSLRRTGLLRNGGNDYLELSLLGHGYDDRITRGNGAVRMPTNAIAHYRHFRPRQDDGRWEMGGNFTYASGGFSGIDRGSVDLNLEPRFLINDHLELFAALHLNHDPEWMVWRGGNLLGTYETDMTQLSLGSAWRIDTTQELRVRLEAIGLDARAEQAWRVAEDGRPVPVDEPVPDFGLRNLGFQIRYRKELAPLSYLYIAYVRGGAFYDESLDRGYVANREFLDAFDLRDSEQFLVKLSHHFEL